MDLVLLTLRLWSFLASGTVIWRDRKASSVPYRGSRKVFWPTEHLVHFIVLLFSHAVKCPFIRIFPILYQSRKFFFIYISYIPAISPENISMMVARWAPQWWVVPFASINYRFRYIYHKLYIYYIEFTKSRNQWICITHNYKPYSTSM